MSGSQLYNRIVSAIRQGRVTATRDDGPLQLVQVQVSDAETRDNVFNPGFWGFTSRPKPGAQVLVSVQAGAAGGVIIASGDIRYHFALSEGECAIYDDLGQSVHLTRAGIAINGGGLPIKITNAPQIRMETPLLEVTGDILDNCDTQSHTAANFRQIYDSHEHPVRNVQAGGTTVTTDIPNQQD